MDGGFIGINNYAGISAAQAMPIFAQSIGGTGGNGGDGGTSWGSLGGGDGGDGGYGGPGGALRIYNSGGLWTQLSGGFGIFAQSVGGGGGAGGASAGIGKLGATGGAAASASYVDVENHGGINASWAGSVGL